MRHALRSSSGAKRICASMPGSVLRQALAERRSRFRVTARPFQYACSMRLMSAFPRIDKTVGLQTLELVRGCTFDDFILSPQRSVLVRRDPSVDRSVVARVAPHHAQAADRLGQHGHRHARADGDRAGGGRGHRHHRSRVPSRRDRSAGAGSRDRQAHAARRHPRSVEHSRRTRRSRRRPR